MCFWKLKALFFGLLLIPRFPGSCFPERKLHSIGVAFAKPFNTAKVSPEVPDAKAPGLDRKQTPCGQVALKDNLVGGIPTPLKNMSSSVGVMIFPIYGKSYIKYSKLPNHQPVAVQNSIHFLDFCGLYRLMVLALDSNPMFDQHGNQHGNEKVTALE